MFYTTPLMAVFMRKPRKSRKGLEIPARTDTIFAGWLTIKYDTGRKMDFTAVRFLTLFSKDAHAVLTV